MLSKILSKSDCASCKFCCSFRRQSLWETPLIDGKTQKKLAEKFPEAKFKAVESESFTVDLLGCYKTDDSEEEAPCPFLDVNNGCVLSKEEKPFDCSIWPLRAMRTSDGKIVVALTPTCPSINKLSIEFMKKFVEDEKLSELILDMAKKNPDMIKPYREGFPILA